MIAITVTRARPALPRVSRRRTALKVGVAALSAVCAGSASAQAHYTAIPIDGAPNFSVDMLAIGSTGRVVGGQAYAADEIIIDDSDTISFEWTRKGATTFTPLGKKKRSWATGISSTGDITGTVFEQQGQQGWLRLENGKTVPVSMGSLSVDGFGMPTGVNASDTVVGWYKDMVNQPTAFSWHDGVTTSYPTPLGGLWSQMFGINDAGTAVGVAARSDSFYHAAEWTADGQFTDLGAHTGFVESAAVAISSTGWVVGYLFDARSTRRAALWHDGQVIQLAPLVAGDVSAAAGINSRNEIVGYEASPKGSAYAVLWRNGVGHDLTSETTVPVGVEIGLPYGIADDGSILVGGSTAGARTFFLLVPDGN